MELAQAKWETIRQVMYIYVVLSVFTFKSIGYVFN